MSGRLHLTLPQSLNARTRMLWDALALQLNIVWVMHQHPEPYVRIHDGHRTFVVPVTDAASITLQTLSYASRQYALLASKPPILRQNGSTIHLTADVISSLQRMTTLMLEDGLYPRAADGTLAGTSYDDHHISAHMLGIDYIGELAALIAQVMQRPLPQAWQAIAPQAPYALVTTFDCDGFLPGQPDALRRFLDEHEVVRPTLFVMAPSDDNLSVYDPRYDPADTALRPLYEISEIGLHSSYLAYYDGVRMAAQKARLEAAVGRAVHGHRSHYLRFGFPYTWGYVAQAGLSYDMTMGFYDLPGHRQGGSQPIPMADPSGRGRLLWSWGVGLMDQHLFMPDSPLAWNDGAGKAALADQLARLRSNGGTLVLDWHVSAINAAQFPHRYTALSWLLREARRDGAWIGGAGLLLEQYRTRASAQHLAAQVTMRTVEQPVLPQEGRPLHAEHYVQSAGDIALTGVDYIHGCAHSFVAALPADATRIADVGCGSGWISHRAPPLRQVLGIDIDEDITRRISRRAAVGCLPRLPLEDRQTDIVLCTDVLEHLSAQEVMAAGAEFDRISTRYAYLQTPYRERLEDSERHCSICGFSWHVSHHLASHDVASLARVMPSGWYPHSVTYTGQIRLVDSSLRSAEDGLLGSHPMQGQRFTCAACGHVNEPQPSATDPRLNQAHSKVCLPLPNYSEVAVMAAHADVPRLWQDDQPILVSRNGARAWLPMPYLSNSHSIDFLVPIEEEASVASTYQIPYVVLQDSALLRTSAGAELVTSGLANSASVFMIFPDQHAAGERVVLQGQVLSEAPAALVLQAFNWSSELCGSTHVTAQDAFRLELSLESPAYCMVLHINHNDRICLQRASVSGTSRPLYLYDIGSHYAHGHVQMHRRGTCFRWLVPTHGRIWTDRPFFAQADDDFPPTSPRNSAAIDALLCFSMLIKPDSMASAETVAEAMLDTLPPEPLLALLAFATAESLAILKVHRSPVERFLLRYDRRLGAKLKRILPLRYYLKLRQFYPRLLRRLTHMQK